MDYSKTHLPDDVQSEISQLNEQLRVRDQLVDQLSMELYRLIKANPAALPPASASAVAPVTSNRSTPPGDALSQELMTLESQIEFYQTQIDKRDAQIAHLQSSCQSLSERNQMLEHLVQELPEVYRQKFSNRLDQVKTKVKSLQLENRRLYSALQDSDYAPPTDVMSLPTRTKASRDRRS
ncbi:Npun_F5560 family protein [Acaryochloris sp. IP29b_bin.148]|uniref:Npun_F5560 family protein n=1 Tax=Acaryochloris sp. IP29b_bin.148 TaxID=2969218 RepID=UPI00260575CB|nr:Npun_F5560 family protein [Acaryochloris sp. IP29b_bin.148]